jgi:type I restriction enzyme S subunit
MSGVIPRSIDDLDGLQSTSYDVYQIFEKDDLAFKLIDLQNIKTSRVGHVPEKGIMSPAYIRLSAKPSINVRYGYWYFMALYWNQVFNILGGGVRQTLGPAELLAVELPLPTVEEQSCIAAFLDRETTKIDALIEEQKKLIELLKEKRQAVISHAVTKGLDPNVPMKDSGVEWLGEVPAHWDAHPLKYLVRMQSGSTPSKGVLEFWDGDIPWASAKDMKVAELYDTQNHITQYAVESGEASLVGVGTVIVVVRGMILARDFPVTIARAKMAINQDLKGIIADNGISPDYLASVLRGTSSESLARLDEAGHGTKALRMDAWTSMRIPRPPIDEQNEIVCELKNRTGTIDALVADTETATAFLQERRSALISAAVTGKIDVRGMARDGINSAIQADVVEVAA